VHDWHLDAACKNTPTELFIAVDDSDEPYYPSAEVLVYCNSCPVKPECLQHAMDAGEVGVWGGTTDYQRRQLDRERERVKCPGCGSSELIFENTIELCLSCGVSWRII
jgi:WhiB family redox-sensing transcriptional regulator